MSSIVSIEASNGFASEIVGDNLEVFGQLGEENIIEVRQGGTPIEIIGGALDDEITVEAGDATILGLDGDDMLMGGMGDDVLIGGEGNDTIKGGMGADVMFGNDGNDVFEFNADELRPEAVDEIVDFEEAVDGDLVDIIKIMGVSDGGVSYDASTGMVSVNGQSVIDIGEGLDVEATEVDDGEWEIF